MFRNLLFTMSLSGSIVVVFYILFYPLTRRYFSLMWRYRILKTALFFYLIPVGVCKYYVFGILQTMFPNLWNKIYKMTEFNAAWQTKDIKVSTSRKTRIPFLGINTLPMEQERSIGYLKSEKIT